MSTIGHERRRRDEWYNEIEPDGSYDLCWKRLDSFDPATARCTERPDHLGPCTSGNLTLETFRCHGVPVASARGAGVSFVMSAAVALWVES